MVYRTSNSVAALLALLAGCFGLIQPVANAGDKIEFSDPAALLEVPRTEREVKSEAGPSLSESFARRHLRYSDAPPTPSIGMIIIPAQKSRDRFGWSAPFQDSRDQDDRSGLDLFAPKRVSVHTNSWRISNDKDSGFSKEGSLTQSDPELSRFDTGALQKDGWRGEDRWGSRFNDHGASDWFSTLDPHHPAIILDRTRREAFVPGNEGFSSFYQHPIGDLPQPNPLAPADPLHSSA